MKRRQRGILTGMPFMANLADQTFVDDLGRRVYLSKAPRRIVSLAPTVTEVLFAKTLEDVLGHISTIGRMVGHEPEARRLVQGLRDRLADIRRRTGSVRRVRTFYVVNTDPLISVAQGSFIHHMIETAGGENV